VGGGCRRAGGDNIMEMYKLDVTKAVQSKIVERWLSGRAEKSVGHDRRRKTDIGVEEEDNIDIVDGID